MDKKEARKILGVTKDTNRDSIERKYSILLKKHRAAEQRVYEDEDTAADNTAQNAGSGDLQPDAGASVPSVGNQEEYSFEQITQAYNVLMGYEVVIKEEPPSKAAPLLKKAGIDEKKARNFFYYYKFHMLATIAAIIILVFTVKSCVNQVRPDFNIAFIGKIVYSDATEKLSSAIKTAVPEIKEPGFDGAFLNADEQSEQQFAMEQKAAVLMAAGDIDLFILDKGNYLRYAKAGAFESLDNIAPKLGFDVEKNKDYIVAYEETDLSTGETKTTGEPHLYGVDISSSAVLKNAGVIGTEYIAAIRINSKNSDRAYKLLQYLMK